MSLSFYHEPTSKRSLLLFNKLASSGPSGPLLARSGCLGKYVQGVGLMGWVNTRPLVCGTPYGMASGGQEEPFSRLALAV